MKHLTLSNANAQHCGKYLLIEGICGGPQNMSRRVALRDVPPARLRNLFPIENQKLI